MTHGGRMTSIRARQTARDISKLWLSLGISALGPIMTVGRVPVEIAVRALRSRVDRAAS